VLPQSKSGSACWHFPNPCLGLLLSALGGTLRPIRMLRCSTLLSTTSLRPTWGAYCGKGLFRRRFACGHQFVDHFPPHPIGLGVDGLPPFRRAPCVVASCRRCSEFSGVFRFSWLGTWNSSAVLALPGSDTRFAWQSGYERLGEAQLDLLLIQPLRTQWTASDFVPDNIYGLVAFIEHHGDSMASPSYGMFGVHCSVEHHAPRQSGLWGRLSATCGLPTPELCSRCFCSLCSVCPPAQCPGCHSNIRQSPAAASAA